MVQVPHAHLLADLARPRRSDEYHVDSVPGPLLSQLVLSLQSEPPLAQAEHNSNLPSGNDESTHPQRQAPQLHTQRAPSSQLKPIDQGVEGQALAELAILEPETSLRPPVAALAVLEADASASPQAAALAVLEPDASVPPPVAELLDSLPATASSLREAEAAIDAELLEVLSALQQLDQSDALSGATRTAQLDPVRSDSVRSDSVRSQLPQPEAQQDEHQTLEGALPPRSAQRVSHVRQLGSAQHFATAPQSLDDLANAIAAALCADFAPPPSEPAPDPALSRAGQRAIAPQLTFSQPAPELTTAGALDDAAVELTAAGALDDAAVELAAAGALDAALAEPSGAEHAAAARSAAEPTVAAAPCVAEPSVNHTEPIEDQFASFVSALSAVAMSAGHSRAAAVLPRLLAGKLVDGSALPDDVIACLARQGIAHPRGSCVEPTPGFTASATAWSELLRGQTEDMSACGETLDHFAANLLCALMGEGADHQGIRRELRKRGVAAFGMLQRAA